MIINLKKTIKRNVFFVLLIMPFAGVIKEIIGSRYILLLPDIIIIITCFLYLLKKSVYDRKLIIDKLDILVIIFLTLAFIQMFNPNVPDLQTAIEGYRKFAFMSIAYFIGRHILPENNLRELISILIIISFITSIYGVKQFYYPSAIDFSIIESSPSHETTFTMGGHLRAFSTFTGPFHFGSFLVISITLSLVLVVNFKNYSKSSTFYWILVIGLAFQFIALFFTRTKSNWIALIISILTLLILKKLLSHKGFLKQFELKITITIFIIALIGLNILNSSSDEIKNVLDDAIFATTNISEAPTFLYRVDLWESFIRDIIKNPVIAYGTSSAGEGLQVAYVNTNSTHYSSHSLYLKILIELGIFGLLFFLLIVILSIRQGINSLYYNKNLPLETLIIYYSSISLIISFLIGGFTYAVLDAYPINFYIWLFIGILSKKLAITKT